MTSKIFGDFFAPKPIDELEARLVAMKHEEEQLRNVLESVELSDYFGKVTVDAMLTVFK